MTRRTLALLLLALPACGQPTTAAAATDGWLPLFDGRTLDGWTPKIRGAALGEDPLDTFTVSQGVLRVSYDRYDDFGDRFGHLFHDVPWTHYRLRVEYRFTGEQCPGGPGWAWRNSGVMVHGQPAASMGLDQNFPVSIEVQLLGGDGQHERPTANLCTPGTHVVMAGELVTRHCTDSDSATYHGDDWVTVEIEVRGSERITHRIDGQVVLEYREPQLDPTDADAAPLIVAGRLLLDHGTISLQAESHPCEFRRVDVQEIVE